MPTTEPDVEKSPEIQALDRAIEVFGGSVSALGWALKLSGNAPSMWKARNRVPAEHCPAIERVTKGAVRCEDLRPDVDWGVLREQAAPVEAGKG